MPDPPGRIQKQPYVVLCEPGKYAYCRCLHSRTFPYCDGTHRGSGLEPIKIVLAERCTVAWCACGRSASKPYCDGSHNQA